MKLICSFLLLLLLIGPAEAATARHYQREDQSSLSKPKHPRKNGKTRKWYLLKRKRRPPATKKPVIYLYNTNDASISVSFQPKGEYNYTYPTYNGAWKVTADLNGNLRDAENNKEYPYLFWEGEDKNLDFVTENNQLPGFILNTDSTAEFLENVLLSLGLNNRERTDFITYWAPQLIKHEFAFVQFLVDEDYSQRVSELIVTPSPDAERQVFMLFAPMSSAVSALPVVPQNFTGFERKGLVVVEWGGALIENTQLKF